MDRKGEGRRAVGGLAFGLGVGLASLGCGGIFGDSGRERGDTTGGDALAPPPPAEVASARAVPPADVVPAPRECDARTELDVLFIGNSYTIFHDLPGLVQALGDNAGIELHTEMLAVGGTNFEDHLARARTAEMVAAREWDVVVLQSHSLDAVRNPEGFQAAGEELVRMVQAAGAQAVLFETWPRRAGHNLYGYMRRAGGAPDAMLDVVARGYERLAHRTGARLAPVGEAWLRVTEAAPELDLYASDSNHPGTLGTYLTANVFFAALTNVNPVGNVGPPPPGIAPQTARRLQAQAAAVVEPECETI